MKRIALMLGIAALAFVSCTKDTLKEVNDGYAIDFHVAAQTRASEVTTANLAAFNVTAIDGSDKNYFTDVLFSKSGDFFISNPEYYWPGTGDLAFYAYAPVTLSGVYINNTSKVVSGFTPSASIANQQDFVVATATGNKTKNETDGVQLTFKHKLAQVAIHAKNANTAYNYYIKGVKIANVVSKGDFNFSPAEGAPEWTYGDTPSIASYFIEYTNPMSVPLGISGTNLMCSVSADENDAEVLDYSVGNAMLIPQQLTKWDKTSKTGSYLAVLAKVETVGGSIVYPKDASTSGSEYDWLLVPIDTKWEAGNRYVYTLDFTEGAGFDESGEEVLGGPVKFTMEVDEWDEEIIGEVDNLVGTWSLESLVLNTQDLNPETQDESIEYKGDALTIYLTTNNMDDLTQIKIVVDADHYQLVTGDETIDFKIAENNSLVPYEEDGTVIYTIEELTNERVIFKQEYNTTDAGGEITGKEISLFTYSKVIDNQ